MKSDTDSGCNVAKARSSWGSKALPEGTLVGWVLDGLERRGIDPLIPAKSELIKSRVPCVASATTPGMTL